MTDGSAAPGTDPAAEDHPHAVSSIGQPAVTKGGEPPPASRPPAGIVRRAARFLKRRVTALRRPTHRVRATEAEARAFAARLAASLEPSPRTTGPLVSALVPTRDGLDQLRVLVAGLAASAYGPIEVVVVDNASSDGTAAFLAGPAPGGRLPLRSIRNRVNATFTASNNQAAAAAAGELLLLVNDDVEPAGPHAIGHMVDRLLASPDIVAVGARLVYPRRKGPRNGPLAAPTDLSLQHRGIEFGTGEGRLRARNLGIGEDPLGPEAAKPRDVPAATAACLLVRRSSFEAVGGLATGYDYGAEDVDLCLRLRALGGRIVYEPQATFWHHESVTQRSEARELRLRRHAANWEVFGDRWGPRLYRDLFLDKLAGRAHWGGQPMHAGITVTRELATAGWGDWYTAHELGDALQAIGWRVSYLERWRDRWYEPDPTLDVVIGLIDAFDVRRLPSGIVTVAWVRNWTERWLGRPWFDDYDLVLASSSASKALIDARSAHAAGLMPLATNPDRFHPAPAEGFASIDVVATANRWGEDRGAEHLLPRLRDHGRTVAAFGRGWDAVPAMGGIARGPLAYPSLRGAYAAAAVVVDDTATPTLPYGALNARVFDALATGTLVVTDNVTGAAELFGDELPAAFDPDERLALVERWLDDPEGRAARAAALRATVLARHTYAHRAVELRDHLARWARAIRVEVAIGAPSSPAAETWGDYHFGRALQGALERRGLPTRLRLRGDWEASGSERADLAIHLFGLVPRRVREGQLSVLWVISHPDQLTDEQLAAHDLVLAASGQFARTLAARGFPAATLLQATDARRFRPVAGGPHNRLLFVANSRGVSRPVVDALGAIRDDLVVVGSGWPEGSLPEGVLRGTHVPNTDLPAWYAGADIVLNDTWPDMARHGFISNRVFDACASGAFVISDAVPGIEEVFDGGVVTFDAPGDLPNLVERYLADPEARERLAVRAMAAVRARHTFDVRVDELLRLVEPLLARRPSTILPGPPPD